MKKYDSLEHFNSERAGSVELFVIKLDILSSFTSKGDSSYDLAVKYEGFEGTVQDYLASLRQPAQDAALIALEAAERANAAADAVLDVDALFKLVDEKVDTRFNENIGDVYNYIDNKPIDGGTFI